MTTRTLAAVLAPVLLACGGGRDDGARRASAGGAAAGEVDTSALRSGVAHPRPQRPPRGTPRPDSLAPADTASLAGEAELQPVQPPPEDGVRVMPWSMLTPVAEELLRELASRQEERYADEGRYGGAPVAGREGWTVRVLFADEQAWAAEATQAFHAGRSCVVWGGNAGGRRPRTALDRRAAGAGTPVCDSGA